MFQIKDNDICASRLCPGDPVALIGVHKHSERYDFLLAALGTNAHSLLNGRLHAYGRINTLHCVEGVISASKAAGNSSSDTVELWIGRGLIRPFAIASITASKSRSV